jgi:hypothetical protein
VVHDVVPLGANTTQHSPFLAWRGLSGVQGLCPGSCRATGDSRPTPERQRTRCGGDITLWPLSISHNTSPTRQIMRSRQRWGRPTGTDGQTHAPVHSPSSEYCADWHCCTMRTQCPCFNVREDTCGDEHPLSLQYMGVSSSQRVTHLMQTDLTPSATARMVRTGGLGLSRMTWRTSRSGSSPPGVRRWPRAHAGGHSVCTWSGC